MTDGQPDTHEPLFALDRQVCDACLPYKDTAPVKAAGFVGQIGDQMPMRMLAGALVLGGVALRDPRLLHAGLRTAASHELATLMKDFVKKRVDRKRPRSARRDGDDEPRKGHKRSKEDTSFPSGHSAGALAGAAALGAVYPEHRGKALAAGLTVGAIQVPTCAHYPSDVVTGMAIGATAEACVGLGERLLRTLWRR